MLRAHSLLYAIVISLIVAALSSALILLAYFYRLQMQKFTLQAKVQREAEGALNVLLEQAAPVSLGGQKELTLFPDQTARITAKRIPWGLYEVAVVEAETGNYKTTKIAQLGQRREGVAQAAIYLPDHNKPLSLAGRTTIKGKAYLPEAGVERAYIEGQNYTGKRLIYGKQRKSNRSLPSVNKVMIERNKAYLSGQSTSDSVLSFSPSTITNSFTHRSVLIKSRDKITINGRIEDNVIVYSERAIELSGNAGVENVLLYAPYININNRFEGSLQAFASDSLRVGKGAYLEYPSTIALISKASGNFRRRVKIERSARVEGNVLVYRDKGSRKPPKLVLAKDALVKGQVYVAGRVSLKGDIYGGLMCEKIMLKTRASVYENHLLNITIDARKLSEHFVGTGLLAAAQNKNIVKWLY